MKLNCPPKKSGFTLIEVMLAMAIIGVIVTAIYSSWIAILRSTKSGQTAALQVQQSRVALRTIQDAINSTVMFAENADFYSFTTDTTGDFATLSVVARLSPSFPGSGMFPDQPLRRLTFEIQSGDTGNDLVMTQTSLLQTIENGDDPYQIVLAKNVSYFGLEFFDSQLNDWAYDWTQTNALPKAVRVSLGFNGADKYKSAEDMNVLVAALPAVAIVKADQIPDAQAAGGAGGRGGPGGKGGKGGKGKDGKDGKGKGGSNPTNPSQPPRKQFGPRRQGSN